LTLCIGAIAGIIFTMYALSESLKITLHDEEIETSVKNHKQTFAKRDLSAIYIDEKQLIFLGNDDQELFRETKPENKTEVIRDAFEKYGYPWKEQDPFTGQYFLWVEQHPELDTQTNALLTAREIALEKKQDKKIADLRKELANIGIVIYDEAGKQ